LYCCVGQREPNISEEQLNLAPVSAGFLPDTLEDCIVSIFDPEDGGAICSSGDLSKLHSVTTQKTVLFRSFNVLVFLSRLNTATSPVMFGIISTAFKVENK
jgi:hypothetical protein